jgi:hypothetical protein
MESFDWDALPSNRLRQLTPEEMAEKRAELLEKRRLNQLAVCLVCRHLPYVDAE